MAVQEAKCGLEKLIGSSLTGGESVAEVAANAKAVGLYFSAHWCPPCRKFTPQLVDAYDHLKAEKGFEVIFISSDKDEAAFNEYFETMPWKALPYNNRSKVITSRLKSKFGVSGIPSLIVVDPQTGKVITKSGRAEFSKDTKGENFPWREKQLYEILEDGEADLIGQDDTSVTVSSLKELDYLGVYFSAHWCGPCRFFTPTLVKTYQTLKDQGKRFEIVFASSDSSQKEFDEYFGEMPWVALPHGDDRKKELSSRCGVRGIPTFIIFDAKTGKVVNAGARGNVDSDTECKDFPWAEAASSGDAKAFNPMKEGGAAINSAPCLIAWNPTGSDFAAIETVANEVFAKQEANEADSAIQFFHAEDGDRLGEILKKNLGPLIDDDPVLTILDVPGGMKFFRSEVARGAVEAEVVREFVEKHTSGDLEGKSLE